MGSLPEEDDSCLDAELAKQLDKIEESVDPEAQSDARTSVHAWENAAERDRLALQLQHLNEVVADLRNTREMRKSYAIGAMHLARAAVMFWVGMFSVVGFANAMAGQIPFSDNALITLTTGATINVLAAFIGIIRGLFPSTNGANGSSPREATNDGKTPAR